MSDAELLRDIYNAVERLESKIDKRIVPIEKELTALRRDLNKLRTQITTISMIIVGVLGASGYVFRDIAITIWQHVWLGIDTIKK